MQQKSNKAKQNKTKQKQAFSCIPTGKWREELGTKRANNLIIKIS